MGYGLTSDLDTGFGVTGGVGTWTDPLLLLQLPLLLGELVGEGFSLS